MQRGTWSMYLNTLGCLVLLLLGDVQFYNHMNSNSSWSLHTFILLPCVRISTFFYHYILHLWFPYIIVYLKSFISVYYYYFHYFNQYYVMISILKSYYTFIWNSKYWQNDICKLKLCLAFVEIKFFWWK